MASFFQRARDRAQEAAVQFQQTVHSATSSGGASNNGGGIGGNNANQQGSKSGSQIG